MEHKTLVFIVVVSFTALFGCRSLEPANPRGEAPTELITQEPGDRLTPPLVYDASSTARPMNPIPNETYNMIHQLSDFSFDLFRELSRTKPGEGFSFSPVSLNMALAVVYSGAREETRQQMARLMGFYEDEDLFHKSYFDYFSTLGQMFDDTLVEFNMANRVFIEKTYQVLESFRQNVNAWHGGAFEQVDFISQPRQSEQRINRWVEQITRDRIQNLIPEGTLTEFTRLVIANAIYIKSSWRYPFEKDSTREKMFNSVGGEKIPVDFMIQRENGIPWLEMEDRLVIQLPYTSPNLSLLLIRPHATGVADLSSYVPDARTYKEMLARLRPEEVHMEIPKFKLETTFGLAEVLEQMGMENAFGERADFSGISPEGDLAISEIIQKVFFEIDEEGSEAAAATAIIVVTTSSAFNDPLVFPKYFIADRPFLFILKENFFDTPLFIGQYSR